MLTKITGYSPTKSASEVKRRGSTSAASSFSDLLALAGSDDAAAVGGLSDIAATTAVNNMLSLQEITEEDVQRRRAVQQGKNMLDVLDKLRGHLLMGEIPAHMLTDLGRQVSVQKQLVNDKKLAAIIDDIELRVAVELAKLETTRKHEAP